MHHVVDSANQGKGSMRNLALNVATQQPPSPRLGALGNPWRGTRELLKILDFFLFFIENTRNLYILRVPGPRAPLEDPAVGEDCSRSYR